MQQKDEGFAQESSSILIDFNYSPTSYINHRYQAKSVEVPIDRKQFALQTSPYINQQLRQNWIGETMKKVDNIIFNNFRKSAVNYSENNISFDSGFESGNLDLVSRKKHKQYQLYMRPDTNTSSHFQWFYFRVKVKNISKPKTITFTIKNFIKFSMLYSNGLRPYFSTDGQDSYQQLDEDVQYFLEENAQYYTLKFSFTFDETRSQTFFCSQPPYTYSHLCAFLKKIRTKQLTLGLTVLGITIPYLLYSEKQDCKGVCVVIARQHPGQTVGSWVMEGFIKQLEKWKDNNNHFCWIVVPMLNVDGVILGNNRTGVLGHDFNRNWNVDDKGNLKETIRRQKMFPQIAALMNLLRKLRKDYRNKIKMFIDLHGHSSQPNVFTYGPPHQPHSGFYYQSRIFPELLSRTNGHFSKRQCSYTLSADKKNTARSILYSSLVIPFIYTVESTFGVLRGKRAIPQDYIRIGKDIFQAANQFMNLTQNKSSRNTQALEKIIEEIKSNSIETMYDRKEFDSGSEQSTNSPRRAIFQQKITSMLMKDTESSKFKQKKIQLKEQEIKPKRLNFRLDRNLQGKIETQCSITIPRSQKRAKRSRVYTQIPLRKENIKMQKNQRYDEEETRYQTLSKPKLSTRLPQIYPISKSKGKTQPKLFTTGINVEKLSLREIQTRLLQARNSKIGKRILVINAYGA